MIKAVIFDMDGVLSDSETTNFKAMLETLKGYGISFDFEYYSQFPGGTCYAAYETVKRDFKADFDVQTLVDEFNKMRMVIASRDGWQPVENALESVRYCFDKYTLALASGSAPEVISDVVRSFGIEQCFLSMISGETIENCKPAPDIFLMSAKAIGIAPEECAVVEDSHNGVLAAKAAGMMCIGYINPHSGKQDLSMADYVIDDMGRIKDIL